MGGEEGGGLLYGNEFVLGFVSSCYLGGDASAAPRKEMNSFITFFSSAIFVTFRAINRNGTEKAYYSPLDWSTRQLFFFSSFVLMKLGCEKLTMSYKEEPDSHRAVDLFSRSWHCTGN